MCAHGAFLDSHSPLCLWSHVSLSCMLPGRCLWSLVCTVPQVLRIWAPYPPQPRRSARQSGGEETGAAAAGESPQMPPRVFFFWGKSSCSIMLLHTRKGLSSRTAHLSCLTRDCLRQGPTPPNSQFSPAAAQGLWSSVCLPHFVLTPLP